MTLTLTPLTPQSLSITPDTDGDLEFDASGAAVVRVQVPVTSAQIQTLRASPVTIVPAPGVGKYVVVGPVTIAYKFGTVEYTPASSSRLVVTPTPLASFGGDWGWEFLATGLIDQEENMVAINPISINGQGWGDGDGAGAGLVLQGSVLENAAWVLTNDRDGEHTAGDGTLMVTALYWVANLPA